MAHPTTPKWIDFLLDRRQKEGTWAKAAHEQPLDAMNSLNSAAETMQLEVAATGGDAAMMVAMNNGDIRFVHNIALAKTEGEFTLVGAMGIGHVSTFAMLDEATMTGTFHPPTRRAGPAPSAKELFQATSAAAFNALKGGSSTSGSETPGGYADLYKGGTFWCHPALWPLMPNRAMRAQEAAITIIQKYPFAAEDVDGMEVSTLTAEQQTLEGVLQWLWMVSNEIIQSQTSELPDNDDVERTCLHIQSKLSRTTPASGGAPPPTTTGATEAIFRDAMSSMTRIQEKLLESQLQDRERKKMTHRLTDEGRRLFQLLSASDWADYMPTVPRFTEKLLADKDVGKALQYVQGEVERGRWSCTLSNNCLVQFFSQGYVGRDYQTTPSGLTIFMCRPISVPKPSSQKEKEFIIRSTFGKTDLGDEGVKLFAKSDLHVPKSFDELAKQLDCTVKFLQSLNGVHNIGVQGYQTALKFLHENEQELAQLATRRPSVWAQLAFAFDTVFQRFLRRFTQIISNINNKSN